MWGLENKQILRVFASAPTHISFYIHDSTTNMDINEYAHVILAVELSKSTVRPKPLFLWNDFHKYEQ